jgi:hypothetical protein
VNPSVDPSAAEREPDRVTPAETPLPCGHQPDDHCDCWEDGFPRQDWDGDDLTIPPRGQRPDDTDIRVALGADLERMGLMPELAGEPQRERQGLPDDDQDDSLRGAFERRTVSLECLTGEHRNQGVELRDGRVGIALRTGDQLVAVPEVDTMWSAADRSPADILAILLRQARMYATGLHGDAGAELLMPDPSVLAALDGRPGATFWTAPVTVRAEDVQEGWIAVGYSGADVEEPVTGKTTQCKDPACPWPGDCTALTIGDDPKPQHFADWTLLDVRIPAAVTR